MDDKVVGYTRDGYALHRDDMVTLDFTLFAAGKIESNGVSISVAYNKTPSGQKRPYLAIQLWGILIQSGWLF